MKLSPDLRRLLYGSFLGTEERDQLRAVASGPRGSFYLGGETPSQRWPVRNTFQREHRGGKSDAVVVRLTPRPLSTSAQPSE